MMATPRLVTGCSLLLLGLAPLDGGAQEGPKAPRWALSLKLQEGWDSNVRFVSPAEDTFAGRLATTLSHTKTGPRGRLSLSGSGAGSVYHDSSGLNRFNYSGAASGSHRLSSKGDATASGSYSSTYGHEESRLVDSGLLFPFTVTRTSNAAGGLSYRLSTKSTLSSGASYERVRFDAASERTGGSTVVVASALTRVLGVNETLALTHSFHHSTDERRRGDTHTAGVRWTKLLRPGLTATASVGASRVDSENKGSPEVKATGSLSISRRFQRSGLTIQYGRAVSQAFGFGRDRVADLFNATYDISAGRRFRLFGSGVYGVSRDPFDPAFELTSQSYSSGLAWSFGRRFSLDAGYSFSRRGEEGISQDVERQTLNLALSYGRSWQ